MVEELLVPYSERDIILSIKQRLMSLSGVSTDLPIDASPEQLKEDLRIAYATLTELRKDCEQLQELSERLVDVKAKSESDALTIQKLTDDIQRFEDENRLLSENNALLHNDIESMKEEIERLENENITLEESKEKIATELREYKQQCEKHEKRTCDAESLWLAKEKKWEETLHEMQNKLATQDKAFQRKIKECHDLMSINQKLNDSLMSKNKEYGKLNDEKNKQLIEKAKLKERNEELKVRLEKTKKALEETEVKLKDSLTKAVSDPKVQMTRVVARNLARHALNMRRPSVEARELAAIVNNINAEAIPPMEEVKSEGESDTEEKKETLQNEIQEVIERSQSSMDVTDVFINYAYSDTKKSMDLIEHIEGTTQTEAGGPIIDFSFLDLNIIQKPSRQVTYKLDIETLENVECLGKVKVEKGAETEILERTFNEAFTISLERQRVTADAEVEVERGCIETVGSIAALSIVKEVEKKEAGVEMEKAMLETVDSVGTVCIIKIVERSTVGTGYEEPTNMVDSGIGKQDIIVIGKEKASIEVNTECGCLNITHEEVVSLQHTILKADTMTGPNEVDLNFGSPVSSISIPRIIISMKEAGTDPEETPLMLQDLTGMNWEYQKPRTDVGIDSYTFICESKSKIGEISILNVISRTEVGVDAEYPQLKVVTKTQACSIETAIDRASIGTECSIETYDQETSTECAMLKAEQHELININYEKDKKEIGIGSNESFTNGSTKNVFNISIEDVVKADALIGVECDKELSEITTGLAVQSVILQKERTSIGANTENYMIEKVDAVVELQEPELTIENNASISRIAEISTQEPSLGFQSIAGVDISHQKQKADVGVSSELFDNRESTKKPNTIVTFVGEININNYDYEETKSMKSEERSTCDDGSRKPFEDSRRRSIVSLSIDPLKSFFILTAQAAVLNSPNINGLSSAEKEKIPFHKWSEWLYALIKKKGEALKKPTPVQSTSKKLVKS